MTGEETRQLERLMEKRPQTLQEVVDYFQLLGDEASDWRAFDKASAWRTAARIVQEFKDQQEG